MSFSIAVVQTNPRILNVEGNLAEIERRLQNVRADLIVLPELATSGYTFHSRSEVKRCAELISSGPTTTLLRRLAQSKNCALVAGLPERHGSRFYNSCVMVTPQQIYRYRKTHLFWNEKRYFSPGRDGFRVHPWKGVGVGLMICFDWYFPEAARTLALKGADVIAHPSNLVLPWAPRGMVIRSLENRVFSATANRVGTEREFRFIGSSQIVAPKGNVLGRLGRARPGVLKVTINPKDARNKRATPLNDLFRDRQVWAYR